MSWLASEMEVGERIVVKDKSIQHAGNVRFIGPISGKDGEWVGIEWDNVSRGKHNGSVDGVQYFTCSGNSQGGSFVNKSKLKPGVSLVKAIQERYAPEAVDLTEMNIETVGKRNLHIELAGNRDILIKLRHLNLLKSVNMSNVNIARPGDLTALRSLVPSLTHLGMADNLIGSWVQVYRICEALDSATTFDFSGNRLRIPETLSSMPPLANITILIMNSCNLTWQDILNVEPCMPAMKELYLGSNGITDLAEPPAGAFKSLQILGLQDNQVASWATVTSLAKLPQLLQLQLSCNPIGDVTYPDGGFTSLHTLLLAKCSITHWASIDELAKFPALMDVRLTENPVLHASTMGGRYECIARIACLQILNGSGVRNFERRDSEIRYMRVITQAMADASPLQALEIAKLHPRLVELEELYGKVDVISRARGTQDGMPLADSLVSFTLIFAAHNSTSLTDSESACSQKSRSQDVALPMSTTIGHVKLLCHFLFGVDVNLLQMTVNENGHDMDIGMDNSLDLTYHNVSNGTCMRVLDADPQVAWSQFAGTAVEVVPATWLLPPEFRPELSSLVTV